MTDDLPQVELLFTEAFKLRLRALAKRYRNIRSDLQSLLDKLQSGNCPGDRMTDIGSIVVVIYSKSEQSYIPAKQIYEIIASFDEQRF